MDKETLSNYGWIVICVMVLAVMLAFASPFGNFVADAIKSTTQVLFDVNQGALDAAGIQIMEQEFDTMLNGDKNTCVVDFMQDDSHGTPFLNSSYKFSIYVPSESINTYKSADIWSRLTSYVEFLPIT